MKRAILITSLLILFIGCKKVEIENEDYEQFKETEMAVLPETNITTTMVGNALGTSSRNVGVLCRHPNINMWAKNKPINFNKREGLTEQDRKDAQYGLSRTSQDSVTYYPPRGSEAPFRIGDFRGYNHNAYPPVSVQIISVDGKTTPPFTIMKGYTAHIYFKLIPGEIDPKHIHPSTVREKYIGESIAFGGISWVGETSPSTATVVERSPSDVFGTQILEVIYDQLVTCEYVPRLEYMKYKGVVSGKFENTLQWIEHIGYRDLFELKTWAGIVTLSSRPLFYNPISDRVDASVSIQNLTDSTIFGVRMRARYTVNGGENRFVTGAEFDLDPGDNGTYLPLGYFKQGETSTYTVYFYLEKRIGDNWSIMRETQIFNESVYIPIPL